MDALIFNAIDLISKAGFTGIIIILAIPKLKKKIFGNGENGHDYSKDICELGKHASIANEEMGEVKDRLTAIETKMDIIMRHLKI